MVLQSSGLSKVKDSFTQKIFLGNEPNAELIAILTVYFVQGILGLSRLAVSFFLKDELLLSPVQVSALLGIVFLPWMIKPVFGFISDGLPIFGYRRRPYLILSGILGTASWMSLATIVHTSWAATLAIALGSLSVAMSDVIVDSLVVERARGESQAKAGSLQSVCWGASAIGGLITAYFSGLLLQYFTTRTVFGITALFPLIVSGVAWLIAESPVSKDTNESNQTNPLPIKHQLKQLRQAITQKTIWLPTAFVFIWQATPNAESAFFYFSTNELHFEPEFLGRVNLVTSFASLAGVWIFQRFLKSIPFRVIFAWSTVLSSMLGMTMLLLVTHTNRLLGIDDHWFSLGDSLILTVMGKIAFMQVMVLAARLCPSGVEATLFALLMSVFNSAGTVSQALGALITYWLGITATNFESLWLLVIITNLSTLLPLPFINWLPAAEEQAETSKDGEQAFLPDLMSELVVREPESKIVE
ncbi:folate/biopterin family MFS transporter [Nostoc sp. UCD121]|uniref:folate/biopterin family MFS transporter n=1 Tax=unclassified Nostoc TaxID=2593658 RepID=UPI00162350E3|nr:MULTISPECIES: folate/biopterin family MFS transporter [unclassified Nostoc]MBC1218722.1 folate/biopterin family MFS transporter [Nostoc sp. UCD120]MBC1275290.1 folate/biopterin family MFS transporter [Nostoc sp. UCD121]MBC1296822.1 folate/biopterin family MFS transporter [Nostoc sp. UCD122]